MKNSHVLNMLRVQECHNIVINKDMIVGQSK